MEIRKLKDKKEWRELIKNSPTIIRLLYTSTALSAL